MAWVAVAVAGAGLVGGYMSSSAQTNAANTAAAAQTQSAQLGINQQQQQFDAVQKLLSPYVSAGTSALTSQQDMLGLNGAAAQQSAISGIQNSPTFTALAQQGNNAILQNASATGGLRGGNTQGALAQFQPQLLNQLINQQYANLGGMTSLGQNAAAGVGNAGMQSANSITQLLGQQGAATAGSALAGGAANTQLVNSFTGALGNFIGAGGIGQLTGTGTSSGTINNTLF